MLILIYGRNSNKEVMSSMSINFYLISLISNFYLNIKSNLYLIYLIYIKYNLYLVDVTIAVPCVNSALDLSIVETIGKI